MRDWRRMKASRFHHSRQASRPKRMNVLESAIWVTWLRVAFHF